MRLIDADALMGKICARLSIKGTEYLLPSERDMYKVIDEAPTIDAVPVRHGRWDTEILTDACGCKHAYYACSVCGFSQNWDEFDYCPNCGADMRGEEE